MYYTKCNGFNTNEREILLSLVEITHEDRIFEILKTLAEDCKSGSSSEVSNEQSPEHYKTDYEPIHFISKWNLSFEEGSIVKYITRYKSKNGAIDLNKIYFYFIQMKYGSYENTKSIL